MRTKTKKLRFPVTLSALSAVAVVIAPAAVACADAGCDHVKNSAKIESVSAGAVALSDKVPAQVPIQEGFNQPGVLQKFSEMKIVVADFSEPLLEKKLSKEAVKSIIVHGLSDSPYKICDDASDCCSRAKDQANTGKGCDMANLPILYLKLKTRPVSQNPKISAFTLSLSLVEKVKVARNGTEAMVAVWSKNDTGKIEKDNIDEIVQQITAAVAGFRAELDQANPRQSASK